MRHAKPVRLKTAPTRGESVYLFLEFTIVDVFSTNTSYFCGIRKENTIREDSNQYMAVFLPIQRSNRRIP